MVGYLKHLLMGQNEFASGGLMLMLVGGVVASLRQIPERLWGWIVEQTTMTLCVKDEDAAFRWVKEWFVEQEFLKRVRWLDLDSTLRGRELAMIPAPGMHRFLRGRRLFWVWFSRSDESRGPVTRRLESFTFRTIGRDTRVLRAFVDEVVACHHRKVRSASYLYVWDDGWDTVEAYQPRSIESVLLKAGEKERLLADLARFRGARDRYRRLGVPYHRGYLLYGPPGTGKTSLVSALAEQMGMSIYAFNLTELNDRSLKKAMNWVSENSVILFEDIDCMKAGHRRAGVGSDGKPVASTRPNGTATPEAASQMLGVTLSGLLNVLDGFHAPENVVYVMTSNEADALDPALLRPGRIDYRLYMGRAVDEQKAELYRRFFPRATKDEAMAFAQNRKAETMAEFQGLLLALEQELSALEEMLRE